MDRRHDGRAIGASGGGDGCDERSRAARHVERHDRIRNGRVSADAASRSRPVERRLRGRTMYSLRPAPPRLSGRRARTHTQVMPSRAIAGISVWSASPASSIEHREARRETATPLRPLHGNMARQGLSGVAVSNLDARCFMLDAGLALPAEMPAPAPRSLRRPARRRRLSSIERRASRYET